MLAGTVVGCLRSAGSLALRLPATVYVELFRNVPPLVQLPEPPEVTPCACVPLTHEPPESPGSAHTSVRVRPLTEPSW